MNLNSHIADIFLVIFRLRRSDIFALQKRYWNLRFQRYYIRLSRPQAYHLRNITHWKCISLAEGAFNTHKGAAVRQTKRGFSLRFDRKTKGMAHLGATDPLDAREAGSTSKFWACLYMIYLIIYVRRICKLACKGAEDDCSASDLRSKWSAQHRLERGEARKEYNLCDVNFSKVEINPVAFRQRDENQRFSHIHWNIVVRACWQADRHELRIL